ncbi:MULTISPECIES: hypothetical protein [unclassified Bradyrhizobium]|uniref:hypothetical protein n=1 Tax=unclassified Bradyrhizobium TaxID=2631580 RepID=UPI0029170603|nr:MULTISPECIES: hypothetical protein [unclassified Bradyrhizobium]
MTDRPPVLSADALQIMPAEHKALLEVRELFANGAFHHDHEMNFGQPNGFNMECLFDKRECGTTACIGGWMWAVMKRDGATESLNGSRYVKDDRSYRLQFLFYPPLDDLNGMTYDYITPGAALSAIDNFLSTGEPNWPQACGIDVSFEIEDA